jgi:hypothetical protein
VSANYFLQLTYVGDEAHFRTLSIAVASLRALSPERAYFIRRAQVGGNLLKRALSERFEPKSPSRLQLTNLNDLHQALSYTLSVVAPSRVLLFDSSQGVSAGSLAAPSGSEEAELLAHGNTYPRALRILTLEQGDMTDGALRHMSSFELSMRTLLTKGDLGAACKAATYALEADGWVSFLELDRLLVACEETQLNARLEGQYRLLQQRIKSHFEVLLSLGAD